MFSIDSTGSCHDSFFDSSNTLGLNLCEVPVCQTCAVAMRTLKPRLERYFLSLSDPWLVYVYIYIYIRYYTITVRIICFTQFSSLSSSLSPIQWNPVVCPLSFSGSSSRALWWSKPCRNYKSAGWEVLMKSLTINEERLLGSLDDMWTCASWGLSEREQRTKESWQLANFNLITSFSVWNRQEECCYHDDQTISHIL